MMLRFPGDCWRWGDGFAIGAVGFMSEDLFSACLFFAAI